MILIQFSNWDEMNRSGEVGKVPNLDPSQNVHELGVTEY